MVGSRLFILLILLLGRAPPFVPLLVWVLKGIEVSFWSGGDGDLCPNEHFQFPCMNDTVLQYQILPGQETSNFKYSASPLFSNATNDKILYIGSNKTVWLKTNSSNYEKFSHPMPRAEFELGGTHPKDGPMIYIEDIKNKTANVTFAVTHYNMSGYVRHKKHIENDGLRIVFFQIHLRSEDGTGPMWLEMVWTPDPHTYLKCNEKQPGLYISIKDIHKTEVRQFRLANCSNDYAVGKRIRASMRFDSTGKLFASVNDGHLEALNYTIPNRTYDKQQFTIKSGNYPQMNGMTNPDRITVMRFERITWI